MSFYVNLNGDKVPVKPTDIVCDGIIQTVALDGEITDEYQRFLYNNETRKFYEYRPFMKYCMDFNKR